MYLEIYANYTDIFFSVLLSLQKKIVLVSKVSFFFRIWKMWINHSNHFIGGNTKRCSLHESFIRTQCFLDIQLSCHFVVLLIRFFWDFYSHILVPLHLTKHLEAIGQAYKTGGQAGDPIYYALYELGRILQKEKLLFKIYLTIITFLIIAD